MADKYKQDIEPKNNKNQYHGYQEWSEYDSDEIYYRGKRVNGKVVGYQEWNCYLIPINGLTTSNVNFHIR
jgi:hypothetical protein